MPSSRPDGLADIDPGHPLWGTVAHQEALQQRDEQRVALDEWPEPSSPDLERQRHAAHPEVQ